MLPYDRRHITAVASCAWQTTKWGEREKGGGVG